MLSHVPFLVDEDGGWAHLHLVRSNPIARTLRNGTLQARIAVSGPDSYVSPDWYGAEDQVPTWNYIAVHLTGVLELRPQEDLHALLDQQSAHFEDQLLPKTPWTSAKMSGRSDGQDDAPNRAVRDARDRRRWYLEDEPEQT